MSDLSILLAKIALILALAILGHAALQRSVPHVFRVALLRRARLEPAEELAKRQMTLSRVTLWTGEFLILILVILTIVDQFGISIAPAIASLGVLGIALGFGAQALVRDVISGLFVLLEDQYRVGDIVRIGMITGTVEEISLRRTILRDMDGVVHSIPNGEIRISSNLTREMGKINLDIPVAYGTDLDRVRSVIDQTGQALAADGTYGLLITEAPRMLRVEGFQDSGVLVKITGTTRPGKHWEVAGELRRRLLLAFAEAGIGLPYSPRIDIVKEPVSGA